MPVNGDKLFSFVAYLESLLKSIISENGQSFHSFFTLKVVLDDLIGLIFNEFEAGGLFLSGGGCGALARLFTVDELVFHLQDRRRLLVDYLLNNVDLLLQLLFRRLNLRYQLIRRPAEPTDRIARPGRRFC